MDDRSDPVEGVLEKTQEEIANSYTMVRTIKYNSVVYRKGDKVLATDECAEVFLRNGYIR